MLHIYFGGYRNQKPLHFYATFVIDTFRFVPFFLAAVMPLHNPRNSIHRRI